MLIRRGVVNRSASTGKSDCGTGRFWWRATRRWGLVQRFPLSQVRFSVRIPRPTMGQPMTVLGWHTRPRLSRASPEIPLFVKM